MKKRKYQNARGTVKVRAEILYADAVIHLYSELITIHQANTTPTTRKTLRATQYSMCIYTCIMYVFYFFTLYIHVRG